MSYEKQRCKRILSCLHRSYTKCHRLSLQVVCIADLFLSVRLPVSIFFLFSGKLSDDKVCSNQPYSAEEENHRREDAEEIAQESFVKAYKSLHTFKGKAKFSTWMYRITYNTCISEVRKKKIHYTSTDDIQISDEAEEMNLDGIPAENREKAVKAALEKLPE